MKAVLLSQHFAMFIYTCSGTSCQLAYNVKYTCNPVYPIPGSNLGQLCLSTLGGWWDYVEGS